MNFYFNLFEVKQAVFEGISILLSPYWSEFMTYMTTLILVFHTVKCGLVGCELNAGRLCTYCLRLIFVRNSEVPLAK